MVWQISQHWNDSRVASAHVFAHLAPVFAHLGHANLSNKTSRGPFFRRVCQMSRPLQRENPGESTEHVSSKAFG